MRQIFHHSEADEVVKRIEPLGATPLGQFDGRPDEILFVPILQLAQAHSDDAAGGLAIVSVHV